jgi:hypothetical protein
MARSDMERRFAGTPELVERRLELCSRLSPALRLPHPGNGAEHGESKMNGDFQPGSSHPLGATVQDDGTNFSLFSRSASRVELVFFDRADDARPSGSIELNPEGHRTYHYWHAFVPGIKAGQLYGYRVHGPSDPARGMRFDPTKVRWIRTAAAWLCRPHTIARRPNNPATMPARP